MTALSYVHGTSETPLLGETIGDNLRRTALRCGDSDALVVRSQGYRATYRQLWDQTTEVALGLIAHGVNKGDRVGIWSPNRFEWVVTQYAAARVGADPGQPQPRLQDLGAAVRARAVGHQRAAAREGVPAERLQGHAGRGARRLPGAAPRARARRGVEDADRLGPRRGPARARGPRALAAVRRPDQHPVHVGHHGLPQGRDAVAPQRAQQRLLRGRGAAADRARSHVRAGAVLPLLRHGHGQPRVHLARRRHRRAGRGVRAARRARDRRRRAVHRPVWRPHDVHRRARSARLRLVRSVEPAHRHHGGLAVPRAGDAKRGVAHAHGGGHHLLRR